jgi:transaldolase
MKLIIIVSLVAVAVIAGSVLAILSAQQGERTTISEFAPKVNFITFGAERQEITVGESTIILYNVQNSEDRVIDDARVVVTIGPEVGDTYLSISNRTVDLPVLNTDARTGEIKITITATGTPATEAVYVGKGILSAEGTKTDVR